MNGNGLNYYKHRASLTYSCPRQTTRSNLRGAQNHKQQPDKSTWRMQEPLRKTLKATGPSMSTYRKHSSNIQDLEPKHLHLLSPKLKATGPGLEAEESQHRNPHDFKDFPTIKLSGLETTLTQTNFLATL